MAFRTAGFHISFTSTQLNERIRNYPKPVVALIDGIQDSCRLGGSTSTAEKSTGQLIETQTVTFSCDANLCQILPTPAPIADRTAVLP